MGWLWLPAFLVLPNCSLEEGGLAPAANFNPGTQPWGSAIFCDIESKAAGRHCASSDDVDRAFP